MSSKTATKFHKTLGPINREMKAVRMGQMKVSPVCQRKLNPHRVNYLNKQFEPDKLGTPIVSFREGHYWIIDGQHRYEAIKLWNGPGWEEIHIDCWVVSGLTETQEAELFLGYNDYLGVECFDKFRLAVQAGRPDETAVERIVADQELKISKADVKGAVSAVGTLLRVYRRNGAESLARALAILRDSWGDPAYEASLIDGFGLLCGRYNGKLSNGEVIQTLKGVNGGVDGILTAATFLSRNMGKPKNQCVAATVVKAINEGRSRGAKLRDWFKVE